MLKNIVNKIHSLLERANVTNWLGILLFCILLLRIPSFFEPYSYGDEMVYLTLGQGVRQGTTLYKDIFDNKPPMLYLTAALAGSLFWFKVILAFWNLATIVIFWNLARVIFQKLSNKPLKIDLLTKISTIIFALLTTLPLLEGNIVNAELFMIGPSLLAIYILIDKQNSTKNLLLSGSLLGLSALFKIPAAFEAPVIPIFWLITSGNFKETVKKTFYLLVGFLIPIVASLLWYFFAGAFSDYIKAAFLQNVGYLSSFRPEDVKKPFLIRNGPLLIRAAIVTFGIATLAFVRKKISKKFLFVSIWVLFSLFAVTLSERPYPHYLIQVVAPVSILLTMLFTETNLEQSLTIIPLFLISIVPVYYKYYYYQTGSYYLRFTRLATGQINKTEYLDSFSSTLSRDYKLADFLANSSNTSDRVFMWDPDSPILYALSRRLPGIKYVVPYHVNDYSNRAKLIKSISSIKPKFIILTAGMPLPEIQPLLKNYIMVDKIQDATVWSRLDLERTR